MKTLLVRIERMAKWFRHLRGVKPQRLVDVSLRAEQETFKRELPHLLQTSEGKIVVITERRIVGVAEDYPEALKLGYASCGVDTPFLVQEIKQEDTSKRGSVLLSKLQCV